MQHAEKGKTKKKVLKLKSSQFSPHKLKRTQVPQRKRSTYKLKRGLNYTENRARTAFNKYLYTKERKKKTSNFPLLS